VSIAAGVTLESLEKAISGDWKLARAMPNICLLAGESATAYCSNDEEAKAICCKLFSLLGKAFAVGESELDAVTALSGSGPAYFYYVLEGLCDAGVKKGLSKELAFKLALQTMSGSARLLEKSKLTPQELRARVTSPGGTTEAAVNVFGDRELKSILRDAFDAAVKRAGELNSSDNSKGLN
jgi:pyrroline-5-carboxylate reductase